MGPPQGNHGVTLSKNSRKVDEKDHRRKAPAAFERVASHITMASIRIFYETLDGH
jgi:hypothetical protein